MLAVAICHCVDAVVVAVRVSLDQRAALVPCVLIRSKLARRIRTCYRVDDDLVEVAQPVIARLPRILALRYAGNVDAVVRPQIGDDLLCRVIRADQLAVLDETDSGLDIDALRIVATGVAKLKRPDNATIVITHYQRLLDYIVPDVVHVLYDGRIIHSAGKELALKLEEQGYDWLINQYK